MLPFIWAFWYSLILTTTLWSIYQMMKLRHRKVKQNCFLVTQLIRIRTKIPAKVFPLHHWCLVPGTPGHTGSYLFHPEHKANPRKDTQMKIRGIRGSTWTVYNNVTQWDGEIPWKYVQSRWDYLEEVRALPEEWGVTWLHSSLPCLLPHSSQTSL